MQNNPACITQTVTPSVDRLGQPPTGWVFAFPCAPTSSLHPLRVHCHSPVHRMPKERTLIAHWGQSLVCGWLLEQPIACLWAGRGKEANLTICLKNIHISSCSSALILFFPNQFLKVKMTDTFISQAIILLIK